MKSVGAAHDAIDALCVERDQTKRNAFVAQLAFAVTMASALRATFALDCCDREAVSWAATTAGHSGDILLDVMLDAVENHFGHSLHTPSEIEWLSDNGSCDTADEARRFARNIGLKLLTHAGVYAAK